MEAANMLRPWGAGRNMLKTQPWNMLKGDKKGGAILRGT
jgi:hypothetical protein